MNMVERDLNVKETDLCPLCSLDQQPSSMVAEFALKGLLTPLGAEPHVVDAFHYLAPSKLRDSSRSARDNTHESWTNYV